MMQRDDLFNHDYYPIASTSTQHPQLDQHLYSPNSQPFDSLQDDYGLGDLGELHETTFGLGGEEQEEQEEEEADSTPASTTSIGDAAKKKVP